MGTLQIPWILRDVGEGARRKPGKGWGVGRGVCAFRPGAETRRLPEARWSGPPPAPPGRCQPGPPGHPAHLLPKVPLAGEGAAGGPTGWGRARRRTPGLADAARAHWPQTRHSLFTMVAAQSDRPRRPLLPKEPRGGAEAQEEEEAGKRRGRRRCPNTLRGLRATPAAGSPDPAAHGPSSAPS